MSSKWIREWGEIDGRHFSQEPETYTTGKEAAAKEP